MMNKAIGLRVKPDQVHYCVTSQENENINIEIVDRVVIPKSLSVPEQLKFLRNTLKDIINESKVEFGCIRVAESSAMSTNTTRLYMEGIIQEVIASSSIKKYYVGQISSISSKLGIQRDEFKPLAKGQVIFLELDIWPSLNLEERESVMSSISALNL